MAYASRVLRRFLPRSVHLSRCKSSGRRLSCARHHVPFRRYQLRLLASLVDSDSRSGSALHLDRLAVSSKKAFMHDRVQHSMPWPSHRIVHVDGQATEVYGMSSSAGTHSSSNLLSQNAQLASAVQHTRIVWSLHT